MRDLHAIDFEPPSEMARLFPHYDLDVSLDDASRSFLLERLLEEGESADLVWLTSVISLEELQDWVRDRGRRQLSRRSRMFWTQVLDVEFETDPPAGEALWQG